MSADVLELMRAAGQQRHESTGRGAASRRDGRPDRGVVDAALRGQVLDWHAPARNNVRYSSSSACDMISPKR